MKSRSVFPFLTWPAACLLLAACQTNASGDAARLSGPPGDHSNKELAFVQAACGGCHAVEYPDLSPNPAAPSFASIANRTGLDGDTLSAWLANAHNYPEVMDFDLEHEQVDMIARQMLTLRRDDYRPIE